MFPYLWEWGAWECSYPDRSTRVGNDEHDASSASLFPRRNSTLTICPSGTNLPQIERFKSKNAINIDFTFDFLSWTAIDNLPLCSSLSLLSFNSSRRSLNCYRHVYTYLHYQMLIVYMIEYIFTKYFWIQNVIAIFRSVSQTCTTNTPSADPKLKFGRHYLLKIKKNTYIL